MAKKTPTAAPASTLWRDLDLVKLPLAQVTWSNPKMGSAIKTVTRWVVEDKQPQRNSPLKGAPRLVLRTWIEFPEGMTYTFPADKKPELWNRDPKDLPYNRESLWSSVASVEMGPYLERSIEILVTPAGGKPTPITLNSKVQLNDDLYYLHESCKKQTLQARNFARKGTQPTQKGQIFLLYCDRADQVGGVYLLTQLGALPEFQWNKKKLQKVDQSGFLPITNEDLESEIPKRIGNLQWKGPQSGRDSFHTLWISPETSSKRWGVSVGLSGTYISYNESRRPNMTEWGITPKVTAVFRIIPGVLDVGANTFITAIPFGTQPTSMKPARFLGINGRVGYRLPLNFLNISWSVSLGYYFWTMLVESNQYGMQYLSGPQFFLTGFVPFGKGMGMFWYFKFAIVSDKFAISFVDNREFAGGGGFQFSNRWKKAWSVTTDLATSSFTQNTAVSPKSFSMFSASLGLQVGF